MVATEQTNLNLEHSITGQQGKLSFLISPTHGGKSTFAKQWQKEPSDIPRVVVTTDTIRYALAGKRYTKELEPVIFAHKYVMIKTLLLENYHILANGTNTTKFSIQRLLEIDPNATPIVIDTPESVCIERTKLTGQTGMVPVIKRHCRQLRQILDYGLEKTLDEIREEIKLRWEKEACQ